MAKNVATATVTVTATVGNTDDAELFGKALTAESAAELSARIKALSVEYSALIYRAFAGQVWTALGLASWDAWCTEYLLTKVSRPTKAGRVALVKALTEQGMTTRQIGSALGVNASQVTRALKEDVAEDGTTGAEQAEKTAKTVDERLESAVKALEKLLVQQGAEIQASQSAMQMLTALRSKLTAALPAGK